MLLDTTTTTLFELALPIVEMKGVPAIGAKNAVPPVVPKL